MPQINVPTEEVTVSLDRLTKTGLTYSCEHSDLRDVLPLGTWPRVVRVADLVFVTSSVTTRLGELAYVTYQGPGLATLTIFND